MLCLISIYSEYAWLLPLKDKNGITITNPFRKTLDESGLKPNKLWLDKSSNRSMESWLQTNDVEMYSTNNEGKPVASKRFMRTLK